MKHVAFLISVVTLLSCSDSSTKETNTTKTTATDCCTELENAKNELRLKQMELELLRLQLMAMEDSMVRISQKQ